MVDPRLDGLRDFLVQLSNMQVDAARHGLALRHVTFTHPFQSSFAWSPERSRDGAPWRVAEVFPLAPVPPGGFFAGHDERLETEWQPAAAAPAELHVAYLLYSLAEELSAFAESGLALDDLTISDGGHADLSVGRRSVRVQVADRSAPLEFPAMYIRERLESAAPGEALLDLRATL